MPGLPDRREFLVAAGTLLGSAALAATPSPRAAAGENTGKIRKALKYSMIRGDLSVVEKFRMVQELGFEGVEVHTRDKTPKEEFAAARDRTGLKIHGVLNSSDPDIVSAIDLARFLGADSVLVVAGRVTKETGYDQNYAESQAIIRQAIPHAEKHNVRLLVENVWNNFLLSPLEMATYIDELKSPMVGAYFDVGNVIRYGWPEHWIPVLGKRIGKLDIKEYSRAKQMSEGVRRGFDVELGEGDCDWPAVRRELARIGYRGWATAEVPGGDRDRLRDISERMTRVLDL